MVKVEIWLLFSWSEAWSGPYSIFKMTYKSASLTQIVASYSFSYTSTSKNSEEVWKEAQCHTENKVLSILDRMDI